MTSPKLLIPLRVPELGPALGKLVTGTGHRPGGLQLDAVRARLVTRLLEAAGEARRLAANGERDAALTVLGLRTWLDAWEEAVAGVATRLVEHVNAWLDAEAAAARMPGRLRRDVQLDSSEAGAVAARLGAAGAEVVTALDVLDRAAARLAGATALEKDALAAWQDALARAARRLEAAWLALEDQVDREMRHWGTVADAVARWSRSLWPVFAVGVPAVALATAVGLVLGGWLPVPAWLADLWGTLAR